MSADTIKALVEEHGRWLVAFLRGLTGNRDEADDVFQDLWVRVIKSGVELRAGEAKAYLARAARAVWIDRLRRRRPAVSLDEADEEGESAAARLEDTAPTPGERFESNATALDVRAAIDALPGKWREVVLMRVEAEMEFKDIAAELGVPLGTALTWMRRATEELKRRLRRTV